jgi:phosphoserine phosphatase
VRELNGDTIFEIVKDPNPDKVVVEYRAQLPLEVEFLETIATVLVRMRDLGRAPRLDQVATLVHDYYAQVPTVTLRASDLAEKGRSLLNVLAGFQGDNDVVELLFKALPSALGIGKELALWSRDDTALIVDFETALRESVEAVDGYPKRVADRVLETVADIFDVRGHAKPDIVAKVENWYRSLDPSVKEARFRGDAEHLLKCCNLTSSDDVEQRFLTDLPGEFALKAYTEWEDVSNALESYRSKMQSAKVEIEKRQRRAAPPPPTTRLPREAEQLLASLRDRIHKSRKTLSSLEVIRVLEALLAECRKAAESRK